jgi:hypothetical protein
MVIITGILVLEAIRRRVLSNLWTSYMETVVEFYKSRIREVCNEDPRCSSRLEAAVREQITKTRRSNVDVYALYQEYLLEERGAQPD